VDVAYTVFYAHIKKGPVLKIIQKQILKKERKEGIYLPSLSNS
jgi:hypothetical protein